MNFEDLSYNTQLKSYRSTVLDCYNRLYRKAMRKGRKKTHAVDQTKNWISQIINKSFNPADLTNLTIDDCKLLESLILPYIKNQK